MAAPIVPEAERARFAEPPPIVGRHAAFRILLKRHRERRRWSQERLAAEAETDHSLVSRLGSGTRNPTRETIEKLAVGLGLAGEARDDLLMAAGYLPASVAPDELRRAVALLRETPPAELDAPRALIAVARQR